MDFNILHFVHENGVATPSGTLSHKQLISNVREIALVNHL